MEKLLLRRRKRNNSGSTIVIVLLMTSFVLILATLITTTTMINLRMKQAASQSTKSFYTAEEAVDEVRAALGVVSVECFNKAYEEQLTKIFSTTVSSSGSASSSIDNAAANLAVRKNYTSKLLKDLSLLSSTEESAKNTEINNLLSITGGSRELGKYSEKSEDADKTTTKVCNAFIQKLHDSLEDKDGLSVDRITGVSFCVNSTTSGTGTTVTGLPVYSIKFDNCVVKYVNKNGSYSYVTFDGTVGLPDILIDFKEDEKVGTLFFASYALVGNKGIKVPSGSADINGSAYAGSGTGLVVNGSLDVTGDYMVCGGTVNLAGASSGSKSNLSVSSGSQLWAKDIVVNDFVNLTSSGSISLQDDLTVEGDESDASISGSYYGFGYEGDDVAKERPDFSSAIIVNGMNSKITFGSIGSLYVAGRAYIKYPNDKPLATGESVSVDVNQEIYLIPDSLLTNGTKNPTKSAKYNAGVTFTYNITPQTFFAYDLLATDDTGALAAPETREYLIDTSGADASEADAESGTNIDPDKSKTYYYFNFKDKASKNMYANLILNYTNEQFNDYLDAKSEGITNKTKFKADAKALRDSIRNSVDSYAKVGASTIESVDKSRTFSSVVPGNLGLSDDSNPNSFKNMSVDRGCRFTVLNKILAPLTDGIWYKDGEIQTELSHKDTKYANMNLNRYTEGDVYGNIINSDGFNEFTGPGGEGTAFINGGNLIAGKAVIVARVGSGSKLVLTSGSEFEQSGNTIYLPDSAKQGIIVCSGDVELDCSFNGIILSDGIVTMNNGSSVRNSIFTDESLKEFIEGNSITNNGYDFRDIFRYWNTKSSSKTGSLTLDEMTYRDMVVFDQWRKYYDEEKYAGTTE